METSLSQTQAQRELNINVVHLGQKENKKSEYVCISGTPTSSFLMHLGVEYKSNSSSDECLVREMNSAGVDGALIVQVSPSLYLRLT